MAKQEEQIEAIYRYIKERRDRSQDVPSQREIAEHCQLSQVTVSNCLSRPEFNICETKAH